MQSKSHQFTSRLLDWFTSNKADFPWRNTSDPYKILVAEILLRKTTRRQVDSVFINFLSKYPDLNALASAPEDEIEGVIRPLGIRHRRAKALKEISIEILRTYKGKIPMDKRQLMELPSVGRYIANCVLCFAYGCQEPLVDTNVARIIQRVFSFEAKKKRPWCYPRVWKAVANLMPSGQAKDFNFALLDFASDVCICRNPKCVRCPLLDICDYGRTSQTSSAHSQEDDYQNDKKA